MNKSQKTKKEMKNYGKIMKWAKGLQKAGWGVSKVGQGQAQPKPRFIPVLENQKTRANGSNSYLLYLCLKTKTCNMKVI